MVKKLCEEKHPAVGEMYTPKCPVDYKELLRVLHEMSELYPFIGITYMGTSILGRGIPMITLGDGDRRQKAVLYVGAHHGMEWITSAVLLRFISEYCISYLNNSRVSNVSVQNLFRGRTIYVIPCLNVDGVDIQINGAGDCILRDRLIKMNGSEDFSHWQANARGVDLNHNYDSGFNEYKRLETDMGIIGGCATRFSGEAPESEPEVASICSLLRFSREIGTVLSLHTQGEEIYFGDGETYVPRLTSTGKFLARMTGYRLTKPEGAASYGGLTDWYVKALRRPAYTLECGLGMNPLPLGDTAGIYDRLREALFSLPLLV